MSIKQMHYSFKQKLNKVDSNQNTNFRVPEIDFILKEAELMYIQQRVQKNTNEVTGSFELTNKITEDLSSIIVTDTITSITTINSELYVIDKPSDYLYYIDCKVKAVKNTNTNILNGLFTHSIEEINSFNKSSFEWKEINLKIRNNRIELISDGSFIVTEVYLTYIKKPIDFHNAEDFSANVTVVGSDIISYYNSYNRTPKGLLIDISNVVTDTNYSIKGYRDINNNIRFGYINCEMPNHTLDNIVDLAVLNTIGNIDNNYEIQNNKIKLTI
jgi:hypothetical protein